MENPLPWQKAERAGTLIVEPAAEYHAKSAEFMSSHQVADFRKSPLLWKQKHDGIIPDEDRPAYALGRATHTMILEGPDAFGAQYLVTDGPVNPRTGKPFGKASNAYQDWLYLQGQEIVSVEDFATLEAMRAGVFSNPVARRLLASGQPERVARALYCGVACQARLDWYSATDGLVDLKTCDDLTWFESDARRYGYIHQLAFYRAVLARALGEVAPVFLIGVEKKAPYRAGVWEIQADSLDAAAAENETALAYFLGCRQADCWPTGYEEQRVLSL